MKHLSLILAALAIPYTLAQQQAAEGQDFPDLTTQTMTMLDASGSTMTATLTLVNSNADPSITAQEAQSSPSTTTQYSSESTTTPAPSITSVIQATRTESRYIPTASSGASTTNANGIDVEGGASGSSSSGFSLSRGGMIAVIVVVVCVAVFGVLSITLFILAKKRQWRVRESIKRASRRLTGRSAGPRRPRSEVDRRKRSGVIAGAQKNAPPSSRQKATRVSETEMRDLEKGEGGAGKGKGGGGGWLGRMGDNDWK